VRYFLAVAECSISGIEFFVRNKHRVQLTKAGRAFPPNPWRPAVPVRLVQSVV
jgi:hypothetical protein